jgi:hypothetical protein
MRDYTSPSGRVVVQWAAPSLIEVHAPSADPDPRAVFCGPLLARCERYGEGWLCRLFVTSGGEFLVDETGPRPVLLAVAEAPVSDFAEAWAWCVAVADEPVPAEVSAR